MIYGILLLICFFIIIIYLDIRISKLEKYVRYFHNEIMKLNFDITNLQIKFGNIVKEDDSE